MDITIELLSNLRQTLATRLAYYRNLRGWTQHDLAAEAEMSASGLRGYEQSKRWPDPEELERIAKALGLRSATPLLVHPDEMPKAKPTPEEALQVLAEAIKSPQKSDLTAEELEVLRIFRSASTVNEKQVLLTTLKSAQAGLSGKAQSQGEHSQKKSGQKAD